MSELTTGALQRWLAAGGPEPPPPGPTGSTPAPSRAAPPDDRAPGTPAPPDPTTAADIARDDADIGDGGEPAALARMGRELSMLRAKAALQRDPAWLDVLSAREQRRERAAARRVRGMRRAQQLAAATAAVRRAGRERRAESRLAGLELNDRIWQRRALARRTRLLDPTSRLVAIQRLHTVTSTALLALTVAGITWTAPGVHDALVGPAGSALAYIVEPLFSLPLVVVMAVHAVAAQWGRRFPARAQRRPVYALEAALLAATVLLNISPVVPLLGRWVDATTLLAHLAPPALILVAVVLAPMVAGFLATILVDAHLETTDQRGRRLDADTVHTLTLVAKVNAAIADGELPLQPDTGRPSTEAIRRFFACEKRRAQAVTDALVLLHPPATAAPAATDAVAGV